jgi:hypothetical protein
MSIDNDTFLVTDFVNLKIKPAQSFGCAHRGKVCVCVFIWVSARTCMSIYVCIMFLKKKFVALNVKKIAPQPDVLGHKIAGPAICYHLSFLFALYSSNHYFLYIMRAYVLIKLHLFVTCCGIFQTVG